MSREHRSCFRFPLPKGQDEAVVRAGRCTIQAKIINASATGFLLQCPKVDVVAGDVVMLATSTGKCEIRVAFAEITGDQTRLGVERIRDLDEPLPLAISFPWYTFLAGGNQAAGGPGNVAVAVVALAAIVAGALYVTQSWPSQARSHAATSDTSRWLSRKLADADRQTRVAIERLTSSVWRSSESDPPAEIAAERHDPTENANRISPNLTLPQQKIAEVEEAK